MKTTLCFTFTLLTFVMLVFVPNSFAQDASPEYVVRVVYFLPNDREPNPEIDTQLDTLMKEAQSFYADVMESNGSTEKLFKLKQIRTEKLRFITSMDSTTIRIIIMKLLVKS